MTDTLANRLSALSADRRALFEALTGRANGTRGTTPDDLAPRPAGAPAEVSHAQRRLWFMDQLRPHDPVYNVPIATRIRGPLDVPALHAALQTVVDRHEVLRTVYRGDGHEPEPVVLDGHRVPLPVVELPDEDALRPFLEEEARRPFDLAHAVPVRAVLARLAADHHVLLLNLHHIVTDGWSMRLFYSELAGGYAAALEDRAPDLPELRLQYADFAAWQRRRISGDRLDRLTRYWTGELAGAAPVDLPTDRPRPALYDHTGGSCYLDLPDGLVQRLRAFGREAGATLYMTLLAGFAATLARHTGQDDIVVGTSVAGRDHPAVADLIGFFVNTLPLRVRTGGDPTFAELVAGTRATTLRAYAHQELPFDLIVDALKTPRDPSRPPLTSVMFLLDETPDIVPALPGLRTEAVDLEFGTAKYDLLVSVHDTGSGVRAMVQHATALFDARTVRAFLDRFLTLLEAAVDAPDTPLSRLPVLTESERRRVLDEWNDTAVPFDRDATLHRLFEAQVDRSPDATALVCAGLGGWAVSYREVERRANRLAHHLVASGAGPGRTVALCLRRGPDLVVAILAVLKAGGAYVPLDPDYPAERLAFLVRDAAAPVVVTVTDLLERLPDGGEATTVLLDGHRDAIAARPATRPDVAVTASDLAYVIYTSGSTGTPKGIALEHQGVVNNLCDLNRSNGVGPGDAVLALSSPSFDMSVYEVLGMLGAGGTLVLPDPAQARDPAHWVDLVHRHGVTVWNSAPALLELFVDQLEHAGGPRLPRLRLAFLGGDWIPVPLPDRLRAFAPGLDFVALGGATEASIHSIEYRVERTDPGWRSIPYGRPMANQRAYLLDDLRRPVPVGVVAELYLGGVGLARGYLNRPELTAEKFVHVELEPGRTERLYRTGDMARYRPDGVIELLGRRDFRIKLNGLRIEPGEVESALCALPEVREAVVVARSDGGPARLVGYVVPEPGATVDPARIRSELGRTLPAHAVPAAVVALDRLPLNPNGKVDRTALPAPGGSAPATAARPHDDPEAERVAAVWADVLDVPGVGPDDDFFALGGDSFAAVRAVRALDPDLRVIELFSHPTPRRLAARLRELARGCEAPQRLLHRLTPQPPPGVAERFAFVCFPHGGGDAIAYQPLAAALPPGVALWAVSPPGHDPTNPGPMLPVSELAERAAEEIARTVRRPFAVYGHCAGVVAALETARVLEETGHRADLLYLAAALPEDDPEHSLELERLSTDEDLVAHLRSMDGFDGVLDERDLAAVLRMVRHDMTEAARFFARTPDGYPTPLTTPLICLIGDADPATEGYAEAHLGWGRYARDVDLAVLPGARHYFAKHLPDQLAALLTSTHRTDQHAMEDNDE